MLEQDILFQVLQAKLVPTVTGISCAHLKHFIFRAVMYTEKNIYNCVIFQQAK